jgi:hypothetical protein
VALVMTLVGLGIAPRALVDSRFAASDDILRQRQERMLKNSSERLVVRVWERRAAPVTTNAGSSN